MRETGTHISHNPSSNAKLGNGIARIPEMLAAGLNIGLGHDAAESSNTCDLFQVMKFASLVHRAARTDASLQQAPDVLAMATRNGAAALGHQTGQLTAGRKADVILVDTRNVMFTLLADENPAQIYSHLVFAANGSAVDTTIIDGKVVMRGREVTTVSERQVLAEASKALARVAGAIGWGN
jgi:5-methylthioadenosine/S-adenosylhomocysteine deaminase